MSADPPQADRNLRTALASGDGRSASGLLDGDLTWVNAEGRLFDKAQALARAAGIAKKSA